ncbi:50S ribosomal protein L23 [Pseudomonas aeruginosa]|nr:50S ribosomal protein L23 [Pseudomonas aeruginosa]WID06180.1 50S ribosomal protein L23 [Pseudomonas aeruginosa]HDY5934548.1 50S ribosomal protein L23 [Pseudomonas aeruginosa]
MNQERVFKVLLGPHISEKATGLADGKSQFVFKVATDATKLEIKKAVESLFSVKVQRVTTLNVKGKTKRTARGLGKRTARGLGKRNDWKKAYIALQPGQDLDFATSAE